MGTMCAAICEIIKVSIVLLSQMPTTMISFMNIQLPFVHSSSLIIYVWANVKAQRVNIIFVITNVHNNNIKHEV